MKKILNPIKLLWAIPFAVAIFFLLPFASAKALECPVQIIDKGIDCSTLGPTYSYCGTFGSGGQCIVESTLGCPDDAFGERTRLDCASCSCQCPASNPLDCVDQAANECQAINPTCAAEKRNPTCAAAGTTSDCGTCISGYSDCGAGACLSSTDPSCPAPDVWDPCTSTCTVKYVLSNPIPAQSPQSASVKIIGDFNVEGNIVVDDTGTVPSSTRGISFETGTSKYQSLYMNSTDNSLRFGSYDTSAWSDSLTIQTDGDVGIGTSSPGYPLDISSDSSTAIMSLNDENGTLWTGMRLARSGAEEWFIGMDNVTGDLQIRSNGSVNAISVSDIGSATFLQDVAVNGGDLTTSAATFNLAATTSTLNLAGGSASTGCTIDVSGNFTCTGTIGSGGAIGGSGATGQTAFWTDSGTLGGDNNFFWDNTNKRLGVGTSSPTVRLHVAGDTGSIPTLSSANTHFIVNNNSLSGDHAIGSYVSGTSGIAGITFGDTATQVRGYIRYNNAADDLSLYSAGVRRLTINSAGNVGIGDSTPSYKLDVSGTIRATSSITTNNDLYVNGNDIYGSTLGTLDIGPTSNTVTLAGGVGSTGCTISSAGAISCTVPIGGGGVGGTGSAGRAAFWIASDTLGSDSNFYWDNTNKRLGIGMTSPSAILDVAGSGTNGKSLRLRSGDVTDGTDSNQIILSYNGGTSYSHAIKTRHHSLQDATNSIDFYVWDYGTDAADTIGTKHVMSLNGGNVGIGDTTPSYKLDVSGTIRTTSDLYVNGNDIYGSTNGTFDLAPTSSTVTLAGGVGSTGCTIDSAGALSCTVPIGGGGGVDGTGATNRVAFWADTDTLTSDSTLYWDNANNKLGVGTSSPDLRLHVYDGSAGAVSAYSSSEIVIEDNSHAYINFLTPDASERGILFGEASSNVAGGIVYNSATTLDGLQFRTNGNNTRMVVSSEGNVGIGTTAPSLTLDVRGTIRNDATSSIYDVWIQGGASTTGGDSRNLAILGVDEDSGDKLYVNYGGEYAGGTILGGNVGIGDSTPDAKLDVVGNLYVGTTSQFQVTNGGTVSTTSTITAGSDIYVNGNDLYGTTNGTLDIGPTSSTVTLAGGYASTGCTINSSGANICDSFQLDTDGSASAPAFTWRTDTNTGIYKGSLDSIGFAAGGSNPLTLYANRVKVGGSSRLEVSNDIWQDYSYTQTMSFLGRLHLKLDHTNDYGTISNIFQITANAGVTPILTVSSTGNLTILANAYKPGGGSWLSSSDQRVKRDVYDFDKGLDVAMAIRPVNYTYNGLGGTPEGMEAIGVVAQEVEDVAPWIVSSRLGKLHPEDTEDTEIFMVDPSSIPFINLNAIKELKAITDKTVKFSTDGSVVMPGDLVSEDNLWGASSAWIACPEEGSCSCPDGYFMTELADQGSEIKCNQL